MWEVTNEGKHKKNLQMWPWSPLWCSRLQIIVIVGGEGECSEVRNGLISATILSGDKVPCQSAALPVDER